MTIVIIIAGTDMSRLNRGARKSPADLLAVGGAERDNRA